MAALRSLAYTSTIGGVDEVGTGKAWPSAAFFGECAPTVGVGDWAVDRVATRLAVAVVDHGA